MAERAEANQGLRVVGAVLLVLIAVLLVGWTISALFGERPWPFTDVPRPVPERQLPPVMDGELAPQPEGVPAEPPREREPQPL